MAGAARGDDAAGGTDVDGPPGETFRGPTRLLAVPQWACRGGAAAAAEGALWEVGSGGVWQPGPGARAGVRRDAAGPSVTAVRQRQVRWWWKRPSWYVSQREEEEEGWRERVPSPLVRDRETDRERRGGG